jgi:hypothetical protein
MDATFKLLNLRTSPRLTRWVKNSLIIAGELYCLHCIHTHLNGQQIKTPRFDTGRIKSLRYNLRQNAKGVCRRGDIAIHQI